MKLYLRLLSYARPFGQFALPYSITTLLSIIFGLANFTLIIPMLNLLFDDKLMEKEVITQAPAFSMSIEYFASLFNYYFQQEVARNGRMGALKFVCYVLVGSVFLSNLFRYFSVALVENLRSRLVLNLRQSVFEKALSLDLAYFSNARKGDLISRITTDVQEVENSVANTMSVVFKEPVTLIGYFLIMFEISWNLTLFTLLVIPVSGLIISSITKKLKHTSSLGQNSLGQLLSILDETLGGMRIIKAFNGFEYMAAKFFKENSRYASLIREMALRREKAPPVSEFMGVMVVVMILWYGGSLVINKESDLGASEFMTFVAMFSQILRPAKAISTAFSNIQRGLASGERIFQLMDAPLTLDIKSDAVHLNAFQSEIRFENVGFSYDEKEILSQVNLIIPKGKIIALVGPSGAGKSTLADLIPRFYDPVQGNIFIDGINIRDIQPESLRNHLGIVTQESILFNDTIFNNIAFCKPDASQEEVINAAKVANAHEFILQTENGYQTEIGDRGVKLSGGQRQRLSIARAVLKNPAILILDEATSALDTESEKLVQDALSKLMKNRTAIVIAHRLSTIQNADKIVVLQNGKILEEGSHEKLLENEAGLYKKLIELQSF